MAASAELTFPAEARLHLPVYWTWDAVLDASMPVDTRYPNVAPVASPPQLSYPFVLVENADGRGGCVEVSARSTLELTGPDLGGGVSAGRIRRRRPTALVERTASGFQLRFASPVVDEITVRDVPSLDAAIAGHDDWMRRMYGLRTLDERAAAGELPGWVRQIPVVFTFDLWRPSREVAHTYTHLRDFVRELQALGVPPGAVFYLPGWNAPMDSGYPHYVPAQELGGRSGFRDAIQAAHDAGYRVMPHVHPRDADPYRPQFEQLLPLALRRYVPDPQQPPAAPTEHSHRYEAPPEGEQPPPAPPDDPLRGPYWGWPGGGERERLDYDSGEVPIGAVSPTAGGWMFQVGPVPKPCEAVFTLGGVIGAGHGIVRVTVNGRSLASPPGWFLTDDRYTFPFTLLFYEGLNRMEIACYGCPGNAGGMGDPAGVPPPLQGAWYRIDRAFHHPDSWTTPKVGMNTDHPRWHEANLAELVPTVQEFEVDALHVDSTTLWRWHEAGFFGALHRRLPRTVIGGEVAAPPGWRLLSLSQTRPHPSPAAGGWQPERGDLPWRLTGQYQRLYLHLCPARGFVPVGASCSVMPVAKTFSADDLAATNRLLDACRNQRIVPTLRVNYRDYGLDGGTRAFLLEHVVSRNG
ncbi:MAG: hypothetical protein HY332_24030 [Chloroflexi bacterium]|nr:hypothetical protein [Chloroflexota bacterium]